jgi:polysaccharide pyruvyl transferase WcaK-like protein
MSTVSPSPVEDVGRAGRRMVRRVTRFDPLARVPRRQRPPGTPPTVAVVGWFGHGNYGDELFLRVFREHLGRDVELRSLLDPAGDTVGRRLGAGIRDADAILIGGGDIVIPGSTSNRYWERAYLARPVFIAGVGVPTWRESTPDELVRLRRFFRDPAVRFIGVRDVESEAWIRQHVQPSIVVRTAPDLVCGLTFPAARAPAGPPILGVAVRDRGTPDDLTHVRRLCDRAVELGYRVRRIALSTGRIRMRDLAATERLGLADTELVASDDLDDLSRAIGECAVLATMKFHGVVAATMYGVPAIALMPTAKTRHFLRRIGRADLLSAYNNPDLPEALRPDLAPIDPRIPTELRAETVALLDELRGAILEATAR